MLDHLIIKNIKDRLVKKKEVEGWKAPHSTR